MSFIFLLMTALASSIIQVDRPAHAESVSSCDSEKATYGMAAYLKCLAKQPAKNYLPFGGPAPGMTMDEIDTAIDKTLCEGDASLCDGHQSGEKIGSCTCK